MVVEEYLAGEEASVIAVCDGARFALLPAARDYKRAFDGDRGPNTGGMGAYAPTPAVTAAVEAEVGERVVAPVLRAMAARGTPYRGALYCGLMLTADGAKVIEFNARFGDPETQAIAAARERLVRGAAGRRGARARWIRPRSARAAGAAVTRGARGRGLPRRGARRRRPRRAGGPRGARRARCSTPARGARTGAGSCGAGAPRT